MRFGKVLSPNFSLKRAPRFAHPGKLKFELRTRFELRTFDEILINVKNIVFGVVILTTSALYATGCRAETIYVQNSYLQNSNVSIARVPDESYASKLKAIETERRNLAVEYQKAANKKSVLEKAGRLFVSSIDQRIFPFWYGTNWDFYGTTETPREGNIACGYFVTTVLRDAGLRVNRVTLAQQASENIIKSLTDAAHITRFRSTPIETFVQAVKTSGTGLYVVGLDVHVGFLLNDGQDVYFIHSSYVEPSEVIKEKALSSPILSSSKYRVIGKISTDEQLMLKWLSQTMITTIKR